MSPGENGDRESEPVNTENSFEEFCFKERKQNEAGAVKPFFFFLIGRNNSSWYADGNDLKERESRSG